MVKVDEALHGRAFYLIAAFSIRFVPKTTKLPILIATHHLPAMPSCFVIIAAWGFVNLIFLYTYPSD
ncbi:hypothetical protein DEA41_13275 [Vibrio anguillarum]|uniref:Uncharacterized protein n=2 Tax=Vibrio TaxID=662 RepID=A0AAW4BE48_VIBAN|nr:hypothetical protein PN51_13340 [Vibrio anguillarum]MDF9389633.1 hypothetical protein [Vibrio sp. 1151_11]NNN69173.1 hypothetical protein [Vibrio sp. 3-2(1)]OEE36376.1 hypothetical protein A1QS_05210 [Vibrio ordalii FS-238]ASG09789.1 hypothetical protein CEQ50_17975 [Vibrio anguillarum]